MPGALGAEERAMYKPTNVMKCGRIAGEIHT